MKKVFIIAEAGVNHNGSLETAFRLVDVAKHSGADAVKFQTFKAEQSISKNAPKAKYQILNTKDTESQLEMVKKLELSKEDHIWLIDYCKQKEIEFLSTPFDLESLALLQELNVRLFKIPSGEITNLPYLRSIGKLGKPVIMSTGMANLAEIESAMNVLLESGLIRENITLLHCNTEYPTPFSDVNLNAMITLKNAFPGISVGYSDHTVGIEIPIAAVALGASVIEKHFTIDKNMKGPDHLASLEPNELKAMVDSIRNIENAMGDGIKNPSLSEIKNKVIARKSIVANCDIPKGELFTEKNLAVKRPGNGISPMLWDDIIGKKANRDFKEDELIEI